MQTLHLRLLGDVLENTRRVSEFPSSCLCATSFSKLFAGVSNTSVLASILVVRQAKWRRTQDKQANVLDHPPDLVMRYTR